MCPVDVQLQNCSSGLQQLFRIVTYNKEKPHNRAADIARTERHNSTDTPECLTPRHESIRIRWNPRLVSQETRDVRCASIVRIDADRHDLSATKYADDEMAEFVCAHDKQLKSESTQPVMQLTLRPAMKSRRMGTFHAMRIAMNMTHAAMIVLVSGVQGDDSLMLQLTKGVGCSILSADEVMQGNGSIGGHHFEVGRNMGHHASLRGTLSGTSVSLEWGTYCAVRSDMYRSQELATCRIVNSRCGGSPSFPPLPKIWCILQPR